MPTVKPAPSIPTKILLYDRASCVDGTPRTTLVHRVDAWTLLAAADYSLVPNGGRYADLDPMIRAMFAKHPVVGPAMQREAELGDGAALTTPPTPNIEATTGEARSVGTQKDAPPAPPTVPPTLAVEEVPLVPSDAMPARPRRSGRASTPNA